MKAFKREITMFGVMIALAVIASVLQPLFLGGDNIRNNIRHISLTSLFALGEAMIIIAAGIDLSVGSGICVTAIMTSYVAMVAGLGLGTAITIAILIPVAVGFVQGTIIAGLGIQPFVITLAFMQLMRGFAEVLTGGSDVSFQGRYPSFRTLGDGIVLGMPTPFWIAAAALLIVGFVMHRTLFGRYCYTIGSNTEAARLSGVSVVAVRMVTFVVGSLLAGLSGLLYVAYLPSATPALGVGFEVSAITAAVLGGCALQGGRGSVFGVVIGAGILQITYNAVNLIWESIGQNLVTGAVLIIAVIYDQMSENRRKLKEDIRRKSASAAARPMIIPVLETQAPS
jgi:ribose transport system permease protein